MTEIWKDIEDYEGKYQVSNKGRVKSMARRVLKDVKKGRFADVPEKILNPFDNGGYRQVRLSDGSKTKDYKVHRLVATAFLSNYKNYSQVNHKDENKSNNDASNLEWCNREYNLNYGTRKERIYSNENYIKNMKKLAEIKSKPVKGTHIKTGEVIVFKSAFQASKTGEFSNSCIGRVCEGERKTHKGYTWEYI